MSQLLHSLAVEEAATVFAHEDQMDMHSENTMFTVSKVVDVHHRPEHDATMLRLQAYQFALLPHGEQIRRLRQFAGSCRFVYNKALALNTERYLKKEKRLGYAGLCALLPTWKIEHLFLSDVPAQALQQALQNLERAYSNFFKKRADSPKFHKKGQRNGFRIPQGFEVDNANGRIKLPKLAKLQRRLARKKKFSSNWKKAKARITKLHSKIANIRKDFVNKASNSISKNHAIVCIEDLQVKNMSASAAGPKDKPGKNVRAKAGLHRSIRDASPFELRRQLEYKTVWRGGLLIPVPPQNTSRFCPCCEHVSQDHRKSQSEFVCVECGFSENADLVGAINIKRLGIASFVCSSSSGDVSPSWQKPTESIHEEARN